MEFTKAFRKYLSERKGQIVDCAALRNGVFRVVPYKTLTKVISRFVAYGTLRLVAFRCMKGKREPFAISRNEKYNMATESKRLQGLWKEVR